MDGAQLRNTKSLFPFLSYAVLQNTRVDKGMSVTSHLSPQPKQVLCLQENVVL